MSNEGLAGCSTFVFGGGAVSPPTIWLKSVAGGLLYVLSYISASESLRGTVSIESPVSVARGETPSTALDTRGESSFSGGSGGVSWRGFEPADEDVSRVSLKLSPSGPSGPRLSSSASARMTFRPGRRPGPRRVEPLTDDWGDWSLVVGEVLLSRRRHVNSLTSNLNECRPTYPVQHP